MNTLLKTINRIFPIPLGLYYILLLIISILWTNKELVAPAMVLRISFTLALFLPLIRYPLLAPIIITIFGTIRLFSVAPFGYIPSQVSFYLIAVIIISLFNIKNTYLRSNTNYGLLGLLLIVLFSDIINGSSEFSFILYLFTIILLGNFVISIKHLKLLELGFVIATLVLSIYAFVFLKEFETTIYGSEYQRVYWIDPNYLGSVLTIGMVISFYRLFNKSNQNKFFTVFFLTVFILGFITLGLLASRGAFVAAIVPIAYILYKETNSLKSIIILAIVLLITAYVLSYFNVFGGLIDRFNDGTISTGSNRTVIWEKSFDRFINSNTLIIFFGGGNDYSYELCGKAIGTKIASPHNNFLQILFDYGIVGLIAYLSIFYKIVKENINNTQIISLVILISIICLTLVPLMYLPFWLLIMLLANSKREYFYKNRWMAKTKIYIRKHRTKINHSEKKFQSLLQS